MRPKLKKSRKKSKEKEKEKEKDGVRPVKKPAVPPRSWINPARTLVAVSRALLVSLYLAYMHQ